MAYQLKIPARINILGNPSDANEGDFATITAAVNIYAHAAIDYADQIILEQFAACEAGSEPAARQTFSVEDIPLPYNGTLDLVKGAVNRLWQYSPELRSKAGDSGFKISTWTDVPRQSGLAGSTLFVLLTLGGLRRLFDLDHLVHNDYVLGELTQHVEAKELGITCGFADRYAPLFGGIAYLDYRGKLHHAPINEEPYVTYERLDPWVPHGISLVAVSSGIIRDSGDVHGQMRPRYLKEHDDWVDQGGDIPPMVRFMRGAWETAWRGKIALLHQDWQAFGQLMTDNHHWVDQMMSYCGFPNGAGRVNNLLINTAMEANALGAKLTGAGGGGSVFALVPFGEEEKLVAVWEAVIAREGLADAQIFRPQIAHQGLEITTI